MISVLELHKQNLVFPTARILLTSDVTHTSDAILLIRTMLETSFIKGVILHQCHCLFLWQSWQHVKEHRFIRQFHIVTLADLSQF